MDQKKMAEFYNLQFIREVLYQQGGVLRCTAPIIGVSYRTMHNIVRRMEWQGYVDGCRQRVKDRKTMLTIQALCHARNRKEAAKWLGISYHVLRHDIRRNPRLREFMNGPW